MQEKEILSMGLSANKYSDSNRMLGVGMEVIQVDRISV